MCSEMQTTKVIRGYNFRLTSTQRAKSVIVKLKQWVKKLKKIEAGGAKPGKNTDEAIDTQNASNEEKFNGVRSKMTYTIEELRDIVDDNLANELKEIESKSAQE